MSFHLINVSFRDPCNKPLHCLYSVCQSNIENKRERERECFEYHYFFGIYSNVEWWYWCLLLFFLKRIHIKISLLEVFSLWLKYFWSFLSELITIIKHTNPLSPILVTWLIPKTYLSKLILHFKYLNPNSLNEFYLSITNIILHHLAVVLVLGKLISFGCCSMLFKLFVWFKMKLI